ncbi:MAG: hypothetical protein E6Q97_28665 [Desulfurellales bacterium]|nr:MAG: hypothetical protein E6Q97_28665 [Desulfurellales bacterium]
MTYKLPDKIEIYAAALQSDINSERLKQVVNGKLETYWIGTVYGGGVATDKGYKFSTPEDAWQNASDFVERCAEIVSERRSAP